MFTSAVAQYDIFLTSQYNDFSADMVPVGGMFAFGSNTIPTNFLLCNGQSIDTTTYAELFAIIGYTFGGSGANFSVPDLRDRAPIGVSGTKTIGSTGGTDSHTVTDGEMPTHTHTLTAEGDHSHTNRISDKTGSGNFGLVVSSTAYAWGATSYATLPASTHTHVVGSYGSGNAITNFLPKFIGINFVIRY